jgi:hypothetical protein
MFGILDTVIALKEHGSDSQHRITILLVTSPEIHCTCIRLDQYFWYRYNKEFTILEYNVNDVLPGHY